MWIIAYCDIFLKFTSMSKKSLFFIAYFKILLKNRVINSKKIPVYKSTDYRKCRKIKPSFQSKVPPYCIGISVISYFTVITSPVFMRLPRLLSVILTVKNLVINCTQILTKMVLQQRGSLLHSFQTVVKLTCWIKVVKVHCFRCLLTIL